MSKKVLVLGFVFVMFLGLLGNRFNSKQIIYASTPTPINPFTPEVATPYPTVTPINPFTPEIATPYPTVTSIKPFTLR